MADFVLNDEERTDFLVPPWLSIIIVAFLSLSLSVYSLWSAQQAISPIVWATVVRGSDIASWPIFVNQEYGFAIKYPRDWQAKGAVFPQGQWPQTFLFDKPGVFVLESEYPQIRVSRDSPIIDREVLQELIKTPTALGGLPAWRYENIFNASPADKNRSDAPKLKQVMVIAQKDNLVYTASFTYKESAQDFFATFERMLTTFKFI